MTAPYAHPPIHEAVCEFHFSEAIWGFTTAADLYRKFQGEYPAPPQTQQQLFGGPSPEAASIQVVASSRIVFKDDTGDNIVMVGQDVLSVHSVHSYPGWDKFRARVEVAFQKYLEICQPAGLHRVAVRAINRIILPTEGKGLEPWLVHAPRALNDRIGPPLLSAFQATFSCPNGDWLLLNLSTPPPNDAQPERTVTLDLNAISAESSGQAIAWDDAMTRLDTLHNCVGEAFEASITDALRERFNAKSS